MFELVAAFFGLLCVWLTAKENIWSMPVGIINCVMWIYMFGQAKLYADAGLQVVFIGLILYGWYNWLSGDINRLGVTKTRHISMQEVAAACVFFGAASLLLAVGLDQYTDAAIPFLDAPLAIASVLAQVFLSRKVLQNWLIWITIDVFSIGMYAYKELYITSGLYVIFLVLACKGFYDWSKELKSSAAPVMASRTIAKTKEEIQEWFKKV